MEQICERANMNRAYRKVKANKGAAGVDGISIERLPSYIREHKEEFLVELLDGSYQPELVRGVQIPKPDGSKRQLGIPTVLDRVIQQAILQILEPIYEPKFSNSSYGFRPNRSAQMALRQAREYLRDGYKYVVDMDLEKFFDRVNHDILMERLSRNISDKRLLRIIRRYLEAGLLQNGIFEERKLGMPQGGNLSPLLSNIMLDELDKELERRGHKFCRYADDCNIYVKSQEAGERVLKSITEFLGIRLKLKVNETKSAVSHATKRKFLGYSFRVDSELKVANQSLVKFKNRIRELTSRNRGRKIEFLTLYLILKVSINHYRFLLVHSQHNHLMIR
jgi:RNA-directed DNA polymerase